MKHERELPPIHIRLPIRLLFIAVLLLLAPDCRAEVVKAQQWNITADKMTRYENPPSIIAEGNVILEKIEEVAKDKTPAGRWDTLLEEPPKKAEPGQMVTETRTLTTIKADWVVYDVNLGIIKARGNLLIAVGPDHLVAESGEVDLNRETGTFSDATIIRQHKDMHFEGKRIEKTGDLTYRVKDGWLITCKLKEGETPPWSFAAKEADITDGGFAVLKHSTFRIKNVPILYMPWMVVPVKRTRQTGFLFPTVSTSEHNGFGINLPFFLNLSPSSDLTLYPEYLDKRGVMTGLEFRYVRDQSSKGTLLGNYLSDDLSDPAVEVDYYLDGNYSHTNTDRYWLRGKVDHDLAGWTTRLDLDIVSDRDYLTEFNTGLTGFSTTNDRLLEVFGRGVQNKTEDERVNTFRALKSWQDMSLEAELLGINDVRLFQDNPTPLWKLPALKYTGLLPVGDTRLNFDWDADYVNYWRDNGTGANRVDLFPRLSTPIPLSDYLESTASVGLRDTAYFIQKYGEANWQGDDTENRFLADLEAEIGTTLARNFNLSRGDIHSWSHTFRPFLNYHYIPDVDQANLPQLDSIDQIDDTNLVSYGLDNFFNIAGKASGSAYERYIGFMKIKQGYDLRSEQSDKPWTPVNVKLGFLPLRELRFLYKTDVDVYGEGFQMHSVEGGYLNSRGDLLAADYRYNKPDDIDSISLTTRINLFYNLLAMYSVERSISGEVTVEENIALIYKPSCWSVELSTNYTPGDQKFMLTFRLANIGNPLGLDLPEL